VNPPPNEYLECLGECKDEKGQKALLYTDGEKYFKENPEVDGDREIIEELEDAQAQLEAGYYALKDALSKLRGRSRYESYILAHLKNWIQGGNPYDETIPKIIEAIRNGEESQR
jgi:hypothetical protein